MAQKKINLDKIRTKIKLVVFDFDGVFTDNRVLTLQDGTEGVLCNRSDGFGIARLKDKNIQYLVLSKERNPVVGARCQKLRIPCIQAVDDKLKIVRQEARKLGIGLEQVAYLGNDINDVECLQNVGFSAAVADSYPPVLKHAQYITKLPGGYGAVREFCDFLVGDKL